MKISLFAIVALFCTAVDLRAATNVVMFGGSTLTFRPKNLTINVGDTVVWSNAGAGGYALTAVAADNGALTSTSAVVNISVVAPVAVTLSSPVISNGQFLFTYTANAGLRYAIGNSSNLVDWISLTTNKASGG